MDPSVVVDTDPIVAMLDADEAHLPVLALHGSLTQSGMWIELAERTKIFPAR